MNKLVMSTAAIQHQAASPQLQQAVRLLQMSSLDYAQAVRQIAEENPFLDTEDELPVPDGLASWAKGGNAGPSGAPEDGLLESVPERGTLRGHLQWQLGLQPCAERTLVLAGAIVESLDDDGYLRVPLEEAASLAGLDPAASPGELEEALRCVQRLEPAGAGARDVRECLLLQLEPADADARAIVEGHLKALAAASLDRIASSLHMPLERVKAARERIRRLAPRPGWKYDGALPQYIAPDVIVRRAGGRWSVVLNEQVVPKVRLNMLYADLAQKQRAAVSPEIGARIEQARSTVRGLTQRYETIIAVARAILRRQHRFLEHGAIALKPLSMREIADEVEVHPSTVSRVASNKYMATPLGVFELKYFFSRGMDNKAGGDRSPVALRELVLEIVNAEDRGAPLSDIDIAQLISRQGLPIARRTVTKYRQLLRIAPCALRRA